VRSVALGAPDGPLSGARGGEDDALAVRAVVDVSIGARGVNEDPWLPEAGALGVRSPQVRIRVETGINQPGGRVGDGRVSCRAGLERQQSGFTTAKIHGP